MNKFKHKFHIWIQNWLMLICNTISILTFTLYRPWWDFRYMCYTSKRQMKMALDKNKKEIK